jgi:hypothetical protein
MRLIKLEALSNQLKAAVGDLIKDINSNGLYIVLNSKAERIAKYVIDYVNQVSYSSSPSTIDAITRATAVEAAISTNSFSVLLTAYYSYSFKLS